MSNIFTIFRRELKGYFNSPIAYICITVFLVLANGLFLRTFFIEGQASLRGFFALVPWIFLFFIPAVAMRLWAEEKKLGTFEMLMTLPVKNYEAVLGKYLAGFLLLFITLGLTITLPVTLAYLGQPDWGPVLGGYAGLLFMGGAYLAIGIFASSVTVNQIVAFILGIAISFGLFIMGEGIVLFSLPEPLVPIFEFMGLNTHFLSIARGVIDSRDIIYYMSVISLFLFLTVRAIERRTTHTLHLILQTTLLLGILAAVNYLARYHFVRLDLTQNREYTIAPASRKIAEGLQDIVRIKVFFSRNLPPYMISLEQQVKDILDEYRVYGKGKLKVEFKDPDTDPKVEQEAVAMGIPKVQLNIIEKDKAQVRPAFLGLAILYEDKQQILPMITDTGNLEYELSAALYKLTKKETKTIGWLTGHGERTPDNEYSGLQQELEKQYRVTRVEIAGEPIDPKVDTLLVVQPLRFDERDKYELDQYLMRGGKLFLLLDSVRLEKNTMATQPIDSGLGSMLAHYGIKLNRNLVLDEVNATATFSNGMFDFSMPYPYWVKVIKNGLAADHPALERTGSVVFPWASSLELVQDNLAGQEVIRLASTSPNAWELTGPLYNLDPQQDFAPVNPKPRLLAAAVSGQFRSFYANKPVPQLETEAEAVSSNTPPADEPNMPVTIPRSPKTHLVVVSNSRFIMDNFVSDFPPNLVFMLNLVDWLNLEPEMVQLRSRKITDRSLRELPETIKDYIKFGNSFGVAALVVFFGITRLLLRRRFQYRKPS